MKLNKVTAVPTNIITGFLGAGKTSTILQLLAAKPEKERWAILVNEFGEIGVDGSLIDGQYSTSEGVFIREVPGGCMCCAAGVPMQVALNQLLKTAKPERLLIEPTGLGHPKEVLNVLSASHYQEALSLQNTITLVDARNLTNERYISHDIFNQQIAIADIVVGNKSDLYRSGDKVNDKINLVNYIENHGKSEAQVQFAIHGNINISLLTGTAKSVKKSCLSNHDHDHQHESRHEHIHSHEYIHDNSGQKLLLSDLPMPECGFIKASNSGEGFHSIGWRFSIEKLFSRHKLLAFLNTAKAERIKGVFNTDKGAFGYNITNEKVTETKLERVKESRIEIILQEKNPLLEEQLMACFLA